jgi:hypothetical protein
MITIEMKSDSEYPLQGESLVALKDAALFVSTHELCDVRLLIDVVVRKYPKAPDDADPDQPDPFAVDFSRAPPGTISHTFDRDGFGHWWRSAKLTTSGMGGWFVDSGESKAYPTGFHYHLSGYKNPSAHMGSEWKESLRLNPNIPATYSES